MKPCCYPAEERCVDIENPWDEWECGANGGVLGPDGACCESPAEGSCTAPDEACWKCPWQISELEQQLVSCCFPGHNWTFYPLPPGIMRGQCGQCDGRAHSTREECAPTAAIHYPCCTGWGTCRNLAYGDEWRCTQEWNGVLGPLGTCCQNPDFGYNLDCSLRVPEEHVCWRCDWVADIDPVSCCFAELGHDWFAVLPVAQCGACGGLTGIEEGDCEAPVPEPECIDAPREDRTIPTMVDSEGTEHHLRWTLDTIGTVVFGMSAVDDVQRGYQFPASVNLIRPKQADTPVESCGHAGGRLAMLDDGYVYVETCSKPDRTSEDSFRRSYGLMRTFLPEEDTPLAQANRAIGMQDGYQYDVACIRLPWWAEATYRSHTARCGGDPI